MPAILCHSCSARSSRPLTNQTCPNCGSEFWEEVPSQEREQRGRQDQQQPTQPGNAAGTARRSVQAGPGLEVHIQTITTSGPPIPNLGAVLGGLGGMGGLMQPVTLPNGQQASVQIMTMPFQVAIDGPAGFGTLLGGLGIPGLDNSLDQVLTQILNAYQPPTQPTARSVLVSLPRLRVAPASEAAAGTSTGTAEQAKGSAAGAQQQLQQHGQEQEQYAACAPNEPCSVCHDPMEPGKEVVQLPCQHCFHEDCVMPWLTEHNTCPVCRATLASEEGAPRHGPRSGHTPEGHAQAAAARAPGSQRPATTSTHAATSRGERSSLDRNSDGSYLTRYQPPGRAARGPDDAPSSFWDRWQAEDEDSNDDDDEDDDDDDDDEDEDEESEWEEAGEEERAVMGRGDAASSGGEHDSDSLPDLVPDRIFTAVQSHRSARPQAGYTSGQSTAATPAPPPATGGQTEDLPEWGHVEDVPEGGHVASSTGDGEGDGRTAGRNVRPRLDNSTAQAARPPSRLPAPPAPNSRVGGSGGAAAPPGGGRQQGGTSGAAAQAQPSRPGASNQEAVSSSWGPVRSPWGGAHDLHQHQHQQAGPPLTRIVYPEGREGPGGRIEPSIPHKLRASGDPADVQRVFRRERELEQLHDRILEARNEVRARMTPEQRRRDDQYCNERSMFHRNCARSYDHGHRFGDHDYFVYGHYLHQPEVPNAGSGPSRYRLPGTGQPGTAGSGPSTSGAAPQASSTPQAPATPRTSGGGQPVTSPTSDGLLQLLLGSSPSSSTSPAAGTAAPPHTAAPATLAAAVEGQAAALPSATGAQGHRDLPGPQQLQQAAQQALAAGGTQPPFPPQGSAPSASTGPAPQRSYAAGLLAAQAAAAAARQAPPPAAAAPQASTTAAGAAGAGPSPAPAPGQQGPESGGLAPGEWLPVQRVPGRPPDAFQMLANMARRRGRTPLDVDRLQDPHPRQVLRAVPTTAGRQEQTARLPAPAAEGQEQMVHRPAPAAARTRADRAEDELRRQVAVAQQVQRDTLDEYGVSQPTVAGLLQPPAGYGPFVCLTTSPALTGMMVMVEDDRQGTLAAAERNLMAAGMMGLSFPLGMQASGSMPPGGTMVSIANTFSLPLGTATAAAAPSDPRRAAAAGRTGASTRGGATGSSSTTGRSPAAGSDSGRGGPQPASSQGPAGRSSASGLARGFLAASTSTASAGRTASGGAASSTGAPNNGSSTTSRVGGDSSARSPGGSALQRGFLSRGASGGTSSPSPRSQASSPVPPKAPSATAASAAEPAQATAQAAATAAGSSQEGSAAGKLGGDAPAKVGSAAIAKSDKKEDTEGGASTSPDAPAAPSSASATGTPFASASSSATGQDAMASAAVVGNKADDDDDHLDDDLDEDEEEEEAGEPGTQGHSAGDSTTTTVPTPGVVPQELSSQVTSLTGGQVTLVPATPPLALPAPPAPSVLGALPSTTPGLPAGGPSGPGAPLEIQLPAAAMQQTLLLLTRAASGERGLEQAVQEAVQGISDAVAATAPPGVVPPSPLPLIVHSLQSLAALSSPRDPSLAGEGAAAGGPSGAQGPRRSLGSVASEPMPGGVMPPASLHPPHVVEMVVGGEDDGASHSIGAGLSGQGPQLMLHSARGASPPLSPGLRGARRRSASGPPGAATTGSAPAALATPASMQHSDTAAAAAPDSTRQVASNESQGDEHQQGGGEESSRPTSQQHGGASTKYSGAAASAGGSAVSPSTRRHRAGSGRVTVRAAATAAAASGAADDQVTSPGSTPPAGATRQVVSAGGGRGGRLRGARAAQAGQGAQGEEGGSSHTTASPGSSSQPSPRDRWQQQQQQQQQEGGRRGGPGGGSCVIC